MAVDKKLLGHSMPDQRVFCNELLRFALNLARLLIFNILTNMHIFSYVYRAVLRYDLDKYGKKVVFRSDATY